MALPFLKDFKKKLDKMASVSLGLKPPGEWWSTGNYALNKALSGSFTRGIPVGRITGFCGPSGAGKSYISSNVMKYAQQAGAHIVIMDSENAVDTEYLSKIGVDTSEDKLTYISVDTIEDVNAVMSDFFTGYEAAYKSDTKSAQKVLMVLDSIAMLSTTTEQENYNGSGEIKADQGIRSKRSKSMLRMILKKIAPWPIAFITTDHVYPADIKLGQGPWAITNSTRFSASIIGLITSLRLKEDTEVVGVRMRFETYKSRFAKIGTKIELEVPYHSGMSPFSGLIELLESMNVLVKEGYSYAFDFEGEHIKFREKDMNNDIVQKLLKHPIILQAESSGNEDSIENFEAVESEILEEYKEV